MRRTPLKQGKGFEPRRERMSRGKAAIRRSRERLRRVGHNAHSKDWRREWPGLKRDFEREGITRCERCGSDYFLTPAHSLKRRHITSRTQMREVALSCQPCHEALELTGEAKMYPAIRAIIAGRDERGLRAA